MLPPLVSLSLLNTINFTSYSYFRTYYNSQRGWDARNGLAGATAGPIAASISTIENFIKVGCSFVCRLSPYRLAWENSVLRTTIYLLYISFLSFFFTPFRLKCN